MDTVIKNQYFVLDNSSYYLPLSFKDLSIIRYINYLKSDTVEDKAKSLINSKSLKPLLIVDVLNQSEYIKNNIEINKDTNVIEIKGQFKEFKHINPLLCSFAQYSYCSQILEKLYESLEFIEGTTNENIEKYNLITKNTIEANIHIVACYAFDMFNEEFNENKINEYIDVVKEISVQDLFNVAYFFLSSLKYAD
jgi:hypothetical protein